MLSPIMKQDIHPEYREVLFVDSSNGSRFLCGSSVKTNKTEKHEGKDYPVVFVSVSSASHPFFTGSKGLIDTEGRLKKFENRYKKVEEQRQAAAAAALEKEQESKKKKGKSAKAK